ncbi:hypothetical protein QA596_08960 [Balneolales bacterium ANBcel1]|nr:hypothetical protein [Balneolales bacterium ANBcel1]
MCSPDTRCERRSILPRRPVPFRIVIPAILLLVWIAGAEELRAWSGDRLQIRGYLQGMPVRISADLPEPVGSDTWMEYRLQNRLNVRWDAGSDLSFHWQMRTRIFGGDLIRDFPEYAAGIDTDDGLVNLSWMITEQNSWVLHHIPDRLYAEWDRGAWNIRVGRQRVNWGVNMITNPNDIFNIYSFYDFGYPERPGSDAIRIRRFLGFSSRMELAVSPARNLENSVAAMLYSFNTRGYDIQVIGGYYRERFTTGAGWAGNLRDAGFKGEVMFYADINETDGSRATNLIASASIDYMFSNSLFLVTEALYNKDGGMDTFSLLAEPLTPDNPSFSRYQFTAQATYPVHPLLDGSLAAIFYPDESSVFLSPSLTWSVLQNLDMQLLAQFFAGSDDSAFANAGNLVMASLKYNF